MKPKTETLAEMDLSVFWGGEITPYTLKLKTLNRPNLRSFAASSSSLLCREEPPGGVVFAAWPAGSTQVQDRAGHCLNLWGTVRASASVVNRSKASPKRGFVQYMAGMQLDQPP